MAKITPSDRAGYLGNVDVGFKWGFRRTRQVVVHTPIHNGAKPEYVTGGKEIPNVDDVVTKAGRHDEFTIRDRARGLGERRLGDDEHKVIYVL